MKTVNEDESKVTAPDPGTRSSPSGRRGLATSSWTPRADALSIYIRQGRNSTCYGNAPHTGSSDDGGDAPRR